MNPERLTMHIKAIKTESDYHAALSRIETLMDFEDELEVLSVLVAAYESEHFPTEIADPIAAIKFRMEQQNLTQADLIPFIGSRSKVSEVLSGKRGLSLAMRQRLHVGLCIPAAVMLGKSSDEPRKA